MKSALIYGILTNDVGVKALVDKRVYPVMLPVNNKESGIVFNCTSSSLVDEIGYSIGSALIVDFLLVAKDYSELSKLTIAVKKALDNKQDFHFDSYEDIGVDENTQLYMRSMEFSTIEQIEE